MQAGHSPVSSVFSEGPGRLSHFMPDPIKYYCNLQAEIFLPPIREVIKMDNRRMYSNPSRSCRIQPGESACDGGSCCGRRSSGNSDKIEDTCIYIHADELPLTMAYVPCQKFHHTFELCKGFQMGTVFPELCKPFCGKRGGCR